MGNGVIHKVWKRAEGGKMQKMQLVRYVAIVLLVCVIQQSVASADDCTHRCIESDGGLIQYPVDDPDDGQSCLSDTKVWWCPNKALVLDAGVKHSARCLNETPPPDPDVKPWKCVSTTVSGPQVTVSCGDETGECDYDAPEPGAEKFNRDTKKCADCE